jgi:CheY-like chemotaxis protein
MDIGMPVMNGYEAARRIRARHAPSEILLIALTGSGSTRTRRGPPKPASTSTSSSRWKSTR